MKKIFIISQAEVTHVVGGAITIFIELCNMLKDSGYEVVASCFSEINKTPQNLSKKIKFINLRKINKNYAAAINKALKDEHPDLLIFFFPHLQETANLTEEFKNIPQIVMCHSRPDFYFYNREITDGNIYKNVIFQILFPSYYKLLPDLIKTNNNIVCIPNPVKRQDNYINCNIEHKKIIYLSRIDCWKGLEFLIDSFYQIASKYPDWQLDIYGQSEPSKYVKELEKKTKNLNLKKQIHFKGITKTPCETMLNYDFCVFPSYFEGFPIGLAEALSVGLPCVGLKNCSGVNQLIIDEKNGFLCEEDYKDFSSKIEQLIINKELRTTLSKKAIESIIQYSFENYKIKWLDLIKNIISKKELQKYDYKSENDYELFSLDKIYSMKPKQKTTIKKRIISLKNKCINYIKFKF